MPAAIDEESSPALLSAPGGVTFGSSDGWLTFQAATGSWSTLQDKGQTAGLIQGGYEPTYDPGIRTPAGYGGPWPEPSQTRLLADGSVWALWVKGMRDSGVPNETVITRSRAGRVLSLIHPALSIPEVSATPGYFPVASTGDPNAHCIIPTSSADRAFDGFNVLAGETGRTVWAITSGWLRASCLGQRVGTQAVTANLIVSHDGGCSWRKVSTPRPIGELLAVNGNAPVVSLGGGCGNSGETAYWRLDRHWRELGCRPDADVDPAG